MRSEAVNKAMQSLAIINEFLKDMNDQDDRALAEISQDVFDARAFMIKNDPNYREAAALLMAGDEPDFSPALDPDTLDFGGLEMRVIGSLSDLGEYLRDRMSTTTVGVRQDAADAFMYGVHPYGTVTGRINIPMPPQQEPKINLGMDDRRDLLARIDKLAPELVFNNENLMSAYRRAMSVAFVRPYQLQTDVGRDKIAKRIVELLRTAEPDVDLHATTDARVWAKEFMKNYMPQFRYDDAESFEATMLGWFANAIEAGRHAGERSWAIKATEEMRTWNKRFSDLCKAKDVAVDPGNAHANDYMRGMANGLILAVATMTDKEPDYIEFDAVKEASADHVLQALHSYWTKKRRKDGNENTKGNENMKTLVSLNRQMLDAYEEYLEKIKSDFETGRVEEQTTMYHRGSDSFYEVKVIRRLDNTNLNLTTAFNEGLIGNHRLMLLGDTFSERAIAEARVVIEDGNLTKNNYAPKRQSHLFNDHDGTRGSTLVSLTFANLYRLLHDKLSTIRAPGNVADFFDIDAKCQQICVAIEEAMGIYPNSGIRKNTSKLPALEEALKEWLGETALTAHGWSNGAPRLGKHEAEELFRRATDYFGTHRF